MRNWAFRALAEGLVLLGVFAGAASAGAETSRVGIWADAERAETCVSAAAGEVFTWDAFAWAGDASGWAEDASGLAYATFRLRFPPGLETVDLPVLVPPARKIIMTGFADGTEEWNVLIDGCPTGWVRLFRQEMRVAEAVPAAVELVSPGSLVRDCAFILVQAELAGGLRVDDPECVPLPAAGPTWGALKARFR